MVMLKHRTFTCCSNYLFIESWVTFGCAWLKDKSPGSLTCIFLWVQFSCLSVAVPGSKLIYARPTLWPELCPMPHALSLHLANRIPTPAHPRFCLLGVNHRPSSSNSTFKKLTFVFYVYGCFSAHVCVPCLCSALREQVRASDLLGL